MPYFVFLSRSERRPLTEIWPIGLQDPLPVVPVPLLPGDADTPLDLQQAFTATYDLLGYDLAIDYSKAPEVPLQRALAAWLAQHLQKSGYRQASPG